MRGGDISNELPMRIVATLDCLLIKESKVRSVLGIKIPYEETSYNRIALAAFWRYKERHDYIFELAGFGFTQQEMDNVLEDLDNLGTNAFNYAKAYNVVADLVAELPYRPEVKYVVDISSRGFRYGGRYLDEGALYGGRQ
jgi:hypothetical protein